MTRHDEEIRRTLRAADPAAGRNLGEVERSRMRAALTSAARERTRHRSSLPFLAAAATMATVLGVAALLFPRGEREAPRAVPVVAVESQAAQAPAPVVTQAIAETVVKSSRAPRRAARPRIPVALESESVHTTRIVFTAPGGTQILWFVGPPTRRS